MLKKSKTIAERAFSDVKDFSHLQTKLEQSFLMAKPKAL